VREKVLITGGSGLIGAATARRLAARYDVVGLDTKPPRRRVAGVEHVDMDVTKVECIAEALERVRASGDRVASVIHLAAYYDFSGEPSPLYDDVTVAGTERLLEELRERLEVEQLVFSSSMLVHAPCAPGERISESSPLEPKWDYPRSKVETEEALLERHDELPVAILRIAGVYDDRCHSIPIAHQIQRIYERRVLSHVFPGDTSTGQAFVHLDDVVDAFARLVERRATLPAELTLLIGEPDPMSYEELQQALGALIHGEREWRTTRVPKAVAKAGAWIQEQLPAGEEPFIKPWMIDLADDHYALDITRARVALDWAPRRSLRATLPAMVQALHADPAGWYRENHLTPPAWLEERGPDAEPARA
jgi:nucleoside-diphosphate-sugar epimerase